MCSRHKITNQIKEVIKLFDKDITINHRKNNRLGDTIKWMKKLSLVIRENTEDKSDIQTQIQNLSQVLQIKTTPNQHIIAYTDGSTETRKRKSKNSGYGIHVTTNSHIPIHSGGGIVRSDGNNFIAEMAAATIIIKALPPNRTLTLYVDSVAAIQALGQEMISERKRIKSQGRVRPCEVLYQTNNGEEKRPNRDFRRKSP